ncbi:thiamine pyrophosphate-dependent enzyme [Agrococcus sp. ProA11]|uniref:thiamine pyrophosphate-dependent enzyme n=1 Tax=Agrococcus chionoecetis TaxID=3153752 RepID=UPI003260107D
MTEHRRNAGWAVLQTLANYGVDTVFGIPGTHNLELYRHLSALGIRPVTTRHEQGAGYAADAWSQRRSAAGEVTPGVVITTSGPGLLNALSAGGTAFAESRPMIVLSPGVAIGDEFADRGALHETKDQSAAAAAILLWSRRVRSAEEAVEAVHDAFALFRSGRPRPVHIEVPLDVLEAETDIDDSLLAPRSAAAAAALDAAALDAAAAALQGAERPVIIAGGGAVRAASALTALAEQLGATVLTSLNGKGVVPESHTRSLGSELRLAPAAEVVNAADALLVVGSKLGEAELWGNELAPEGAVIRVDIDEAQLDKNLPATIRVLGEARAVVEALAARIEREPAPDAGLDAVRNALVEAAHDFAPREMVAAEAIAAGIPAGAVVAGDSSQITYYGMTSAVRQDAPASMPYMPAYATLGYGLPAAIGARIASPETPSVVVTGDGALMFSVPELATAVEQQLDIAVIVVDNGGYGEIEQNEADRGIDPIGVRLHQPDWAMLARAFGASGTRVDDASAVPAAVAAAIAEPGVSLVHIPLQIFGA